MRISAKRKNMVLRVALLALAVYIAASLIGLKIRLDEDRQTLSALQSQLQSGTALLSQLKELSENKSQRLEQGAREQGMSKSGESVYYIVPPEE